MARLIRAFCGVVIAFLVATPASPQSALESALVGNWSAAVNWQSPEGSYQIMRLTPDGKIWWRMTNHRGEGFSLFGVYHVDAGGGVLRYTMTDYEPKQLCLPGRGCSPLPVPPGVGVSTTNQIRIVNANMFIASVADGSTEWVRSSGSGFPVQ